MSSPVFTPFTLPCGTVLKNRLVKAAMEENMAEANQLPGEALVNLYRNWAEGGVGLIITGNVMIDHLAMTGPGGLALEQHTPIQPFARIAEVAHQGGAKIWMQINHPGRQVFKKMGGKVLSPSAVALDMGKHSGLFTQPSAMNDAQIQDVIQRFVTTAGRAQQAGFDGVEIHAAHGYLISQFLSPLTNKRVDNWGGSLENRARLLLEVIKAVRATVPVDFAVAVKLNSADFQRGGFDVNDAKQVINLLQPLGVDMVELSGGSYEAPAMQGVSKDARSLAREAFFLEFAQDIQASTNLPLMTTGGITRLATAEQVIASGLALAGMGTALAYCPDLPKRWQQQPSFAPQIARVAWKDKTLSGLATMAGVKRQLRRIGANKTPLAQMSPLWSLITDQVRASKLTKRYRRQYANEVTS